MNIGILQRKETLSTKKIREALEKRGHNVRTFNNLYFETTSLFNVYIPEIDIIYYWNGSGTIGRACLMDFFSKRGIKTINEGIFKDPMFVNKIYQSYRISENNIRSPKTITQTKASYSKILEKIGCPFILKSAVGSCGEKVYLIKNEDDFERVRAVQKNQELLYQQFIPNTGDFRVHVINGKAVCVYKRIPKSGDFRANVSLGGSMEAVSDDDLQNKLYEIAEKVAKSFVGAEIIGVDLMEHSVTGEIYFLETNELPGIKQVSEITGFNIAEEMANYFETLV